MAPYHHRYLWVESPGAPPKALAYARAGEILRRLRAVEALPEGVELECLNEEIRTDLLGVCSLVFSEHPNWFYVNSFLHQVYLSMELCFIKTMHAALDELWSKSTQVKLAHEERFLFLMERMGETLEDSGETFKFWTVLLLYEELWEKIGDKVFNIPVSTLASGSTSYSQGDVFVEIQEFVS
jgi:hypothetical protein